MISLTNLTLVILIRLGIRLGSVAPTKLWSGSNKTNQKTGANVTEKPRINPVIVLLIYLIILFCLNNF